MLTMKAQSNIYIYQVPQKGLSSEVISFSLIGFFLGHPLSANNT